MDSFQFMGVTDDAEGHLLAFNAVSLGSILVIFCMILDTKYESTSSSLTTTTLRMSARQPFFPARLASESQGAVQGFDQKIFSIDPSNPLHQSSPVAESINSAFSVPGPFSSGATGAPQVKTSGLGSVSKKNSAHNMTQRVEKDQKVSLGNVRPGTADPRSEAHQDRALATVLEVQHSLGYQKASHRSLGLLDPGAIVRPGTTVPQSKALQDYATGLDIRAPIPKPAALSSSKFLSHNTFPDRIPENDAHISTTETKHGASCKVDVVNSTFHSSTKGNSFNQTGPQRVPIEQQFSQYNTSEVDFNASSMTSHEVTADGRLKMSVTKKRNRDEIEEDGDGDYWVESQAKRHKGRHYEEFESRGYAKSPPFSPRPNRTISRASHPEADIHRQLSPRLPRHRERRTISPINEHHMPPYEPPQTEQASPDDNRNAFEKLLGRNTDIFVQQNMEKYDRLVKKWSECTEEEWIADAEVITEKYVKIVSYVKDAMVAKINAFANIQTDIGQHLSDLGERDELLDAVKKKLIMQSGNALG